MDKALKHFKKTDPILYNVASSVSLQVLIKSSDPFVDLIESIISQQLSGKAADTIFKRFVDLFPNKKITAKKILDIPDEKIRAAGISYSKISYIKGIAKEVVDRNLDFKKLDSLTDEEIIKELIKIKGIGVWTAEMYLIFTLGRPDIFSTGDLGLQNAIIKHYKIEEKPTKEKLLEISSKWSPYRSIASRILWKSLDNK